MDDGGSDLAAMAAAAAAAAAGRLRTGTVRTRQGEAAVTAAGTAAARGGAAAVAAADWSFLVSHLRGEETPIFLQMMLG